MDGVNVTDVLINGLNIESSYGEYQIAAIITCIFFGITTMQVYLYCWNYLEHDRWYLPAIVFVSWSADLINLVFIVRGEWNVEVLKWGSLSELTKSQGLSVDRGDAEAVVVVIVQAFLIRRVWIMLKRKSWFDYMILCTLPVLTLWQIIGDVFEQVWSLGKPLSELSRPRNVGIDVSLHATQAAVDLTVTAYMVCILASQRASVQRRTKEMIGRLLFVVINTGLLTSLFAVASLIAYVARPQGLYWIIFDYPITTVNLSCLLANLNARAFVRGPDGAVSLAYTTLAFDTPPPDSNSVAGSYPMSAATVGYTTGSSTTGAYTTGTTVSKQDKAAERRVDVSLYVGRAITTDFGRETSEDAVSKAELSV